MKKFIAAVIIILSLCLLTPYNAKAESTLSNVGYGAGSVLVSCVYSPAKLVYALVWRVYRRDSIPAYGRQPGCCQKNLDSFGTGHICHYS